MYYVPCRWRDLIDLGQGSLPLEAFYISQSSLCTVLDIFCLKVTSRSMCFLYACTIVAFCIDIELCTAYICLLPGNQILIHKHLVTRGVVVSGGGAMDPGGNRLQLLYVCLQESFWICLTACIWGDKPMFSS